MKVKDLVEELQAVDPELMVVRDGYEGGVTEVGYAVIKEVALNVNEEWCYGEHGILDSNDYPDAQRATVVYIY